MPARPGWAEPRKRTASLGSPAGQPASSPAAARTEPQKQHHQPQRPQQFKAENQACAPSSDNDVRAPQFVDSDDELAVYPYELFRQRLRIPSRTIWTYWDLGHDFGAAPDDERRELFKTILKHLSWPAGSVSFWPLNFELGQTLKSQPGQFWRGVREARATTVFCFGERAFKALFPRQDFSLTPTRRDGVIVQPLPGPTAMLGGDMDAKRTVWGMLKSHVFSS